METVPNASVRIHVGITLRFPEAERLVDKGPKGDEEEKVAAFRKFWGSKAELRRFKDGSILESVLWAENNSLKATKRYMIIRDIVSYALSLHVIPSDGNDVSI